MIVEESAAAGSITRHRQRYFFCSMACQELFRAAPERYLPERRQIPAAGTMPVSHHECCAT